jgi:DNA-binding YbaB/EbfC family protein
MTVRGDIGSLLKQAQAVQENMQKAQAEVARLSAVGESGGGMVKVTMNGKHEVARVQIEPALLSEQREVLEDLLAAAINDATHRVDAAVQVKMSGAMAGLQLPPGMKLPF